MGLIAECVPAFIAITSTGVVVTSTSKKESSENV